jgi:hypothetical protein
VHVRSDDDEDLNAEFTIEPAGSRLALVLESAGGRGRDGRPRNNQYVDALRTLLSRLRDRAAVLTDAVVDSQHTAHLPESERRLLTGPIELAGVTDIEQFRLDLTTPQGHIGQTGGEVKAGNNRKRIRLTLTVPGYSPADAARLAADLAGGRPNRQWTDARQLLRSLLGVELRTATGSPNTVLKLAGDNVYVKTGKSAAGQPVPIAWVQNGLDLLWRDRSVPINTEVLEHRSSFVGAVLASLPGAAFVKDPVRVTLDPPTAPDIATDPHFGTLDRTAQVKIRVEQSYLRDQLADGRESAPCALCGHTYPLRFLVAAHIKKRSLCTDDERRDVRNVAMLACTFGCDSLYEAGWISVDDTGQVLVADDPGFPGRLAEHLAHLRTRRCTAHNPTSEPYFDWHRTTTFAGKV